SRAVRDGDGEDYRLLWLWNALKMGVALLMLLTFGLRVGAEEGQPAAPTTVGAIRHVKFPVPPNLPVHIHAVATYYDDVTPNLLVQDASGGIWVDLRGLTVAPPSPGRSSTFMEPWGWGSALISQSLTGP